MANPAQDKNQHNIQVSEADLLAGRIRKGSVADLMKKMTEEETSLLDVGMHDQAYRS